MTIKKDLWDEIVTLEEKLPEADIQRCKETARLTHFHQKEITYEGAYVTALMQKVESNTGGVYEGT